MIIVLAIIVVLAVVALVLGVMALRKRSTRDDLRRVGDEPDVDAQSAAQAAEGRGSWMRPPGF